MGPLHIWELDPKTGRAFKWRGQFQGSPTEAFQWMDKHGGRDKFRLNNIPPTTGRTQNPPREVTTVNPKGDTVVGRVLPRKDIPGKTTAPRQPMTRAMQEQMLSGGKKGASEDRNNRGGRSAVGVSTQGRNSAARFKARRDNSPEMQAIRKAAGEVLEGLVEDERDDLEKGINN